MAPGQVDILEVIEANRHHRQLPAAQHRLGKAHLQGGVKQVAVGQARQRVVIGHLQQPLISPHCRSKTLQIAGAFFKLLLKHQGMHRLIIAKRLEP